MTPSLAACNAAATSVHPVETPVENHARPFVADQHARATAEIEFRHSGWRRTRERVRAALATCDASKRRIEAFDACGSNAWIVTKAGDPPSFRVAASNCHDRYCQPCASARSATIAANLRKAIPGSEHRFITFTLRHSTLPLGEQLDKLVASYRRLRQRKLWSARVTAAIGFVEIKRNARRDRWHPHLHVVARSTWIPQAELKTAWHQITRDSHIVDIRLARGERVLSYVAKYASKPLNTDYVDDADALAEAIDAMARRRLIIQSGAWSRLKLTETPDAGDWTPVAPLADMIERATRGDADAVAIIDALNRSEPCSRRQRPNCPPDPLPPA